MGVLASLGVHKSYYTLIIGYILGLYRDNGKENGNYHKAVL